MIHILSMSPLDPLQEPPPEPDKNPADELRRAGEIFDGLLNPAAGQRELPREPV